MNGPAAENSSRYGSDPCYPELAGIVAIGTLHVVTELATSPATARAYNVIVSLGALVYLFWRYKKSARALRAWGLRGDNFWPALHLQASFGALGALCLFGYAALVTSVSLPATFWLTLFVYPVWGIAQQFALQNLIARNLTGFMTNPIAIALTASILFGGAHYPRLELVTLTFLAGIFFTLIYRRVPNLWAVGLVHGVLGSLAYYLVLGEDPGAVLWSYF